MARYKLTIAYNGTRYAGWQEQAQSATVAGTLRSNFERVAALPCTLLGASRTDAGVHAHGQRALFTTTRDFEPSRLLRLWNNALPADICIRTLEYTDETFHPLVNVHTKIYTYIIFTKRPLPEHAPFSWFYAAPFDRTTLQKSLDLFLGTHNFSQFSAADEFIDPIRTIDQITYREEQEGTKITITVIGKSFIRHMIRRIIGAAITVAARHKNRTIDDIKRCLENKNSFYCFENAAPQGLSLQSIIYTDEKVNI